MVDVPFIGFDGVEAVVRATANHQSETAADRLIPDAAKKVVVLAAVDKL